MTALVLAEFCFFFSIFMSYCCSTSNQIFFYADWSWRKSAEIFNYTDCSWWNSAQFFLIFTSPGQFFYTHEFLMFYLKNFLYSPILVEFCSNFNYSHCSWWSSPFFIIFSDPGGILFIFSFMLIILTVPGIFISNLDATKKKEAA